MKLEPHQIIPSAYVGREQAYIKHRLLEGYLERLLYIVGWNAGQLGYGEIIFVDCFAGPWKDDSSDLSSTSIAISMNLLAKVQKNLVEAGRPVNFRAIYVEKDAKAFARLESFLSSRSPQNVRTAAIHGDFTEQIPEILSRCPAKSFAFFFIDPKGWLTIKPEILQPLLARPRSEFLINFMYEFVNWAAAIDAQRENIDALLDKRCDIDGLPTDPAQREGLLVEHYRAAVSQRASVAKTKVLSGYVTILDPTADRTKYHLIYLTRHPKGLLEFMTQSEKMASVQSTVRAAAKYVKQSKEHSTGDLFGIDPSQAVQIPATIASRRTNLEALWTTKLSPSPTAITEGVFAELVCSTNCYPSELQQALISLIKQGKVKNLDADVTRRRKNAVNYEKAEKLIRVDAS